MKIDRHTLFLIAGLSAAPISLVAQTAPERAPAHTIYLIGDAGEDGEEHSAPVLRLLDSLVRKDATADRTVLFLGDNIYPRGLHGKDDTLRAQDEARIGAQIQAVKDLGARILFIPGNHDWEQGGKHGWKAVQRQERHVEEALGGDVFKPDGGCPGPVTIELGKDAVLVLLDTQWWLHHERKPVGEKDGCDASSPEEVIAQLADELKDAQDKRIIVAGHHPFYSQGSHGGHFPLREHLFPLTALNKKAYVPLPIIGSIYPLYRMLLGDVQDLAHVEYRDMRGAMLTVFKQYPGMVYAAGHEHGLQYVVRDGVQHVLSGAGSKATFMRHTEKCEFVASERGFAKLTLMQDGSMEVEYFTVTGGTAPVYGTYAPPIAKRYVEPAEWPTDTPPASALLVPNADLKASWLHRVFFGSLYRDLWTAPVQVPSVLLDTLHGGATPKKMGGGMQTRSLRLRASNGHDYVLRDVRKYPANALALEFRGTLVEELVADGIAASNPYAAITIAPLSRAVGVPYLNSTLLHVPHQRALGVYDGVFGGTLSLLEERPDGAWPDSPNMGGGKELVASSEVINAVHEHQDHRVDERALIRARLFDMLIGDWDRHDDQWRWAVHKSKGSTIYKPVPRDRDQAFFTQDGLLPALVNRRWAMRKFQSFGPDIRDISGQNFNARYLDRAYLTGTEWTVWKAIADSMQLELTDAAIAESIALFPDTARTLHGARIEAGLKGRRERLVRIAERHYLELARKVDVVGTNGDEYIEVLRDGDAVTVSMYPMKKGDKVEAERFYHRRFTRSETKEVHIYGLEGNDKFRIEGKVKRSIRVRIIGGTEKDRIQDSSWVSGPSCQTVVYETAGKGKKANTLKLSGEARLRVRPIERALEYDRSAFVHDRFMPLVNIGSNPDDGFFLGGGFIHTKQGFRVAPFKWKHRFMATYATGTGAYHAKYRGQVNEVLGRWGFGMDLDVVAPDHHFNFFGFGNNTLEPADPAAFAYPLDAVRAAPYTSIVLHEVHTFRIGGRYLGAGVGRLGGVVEEDALVQPQAVDYAGAVVAYELKNLDHEFDPGRGVRFNAELSYDRELNRNIDLYGAGAELALYIPIALPMRTVLALRGGGNRRDGEVDPLMANTIGGRETVRGMRRSRFSGNSNAYVNGELRVDLLNYRNKVAPFRVGLLAFADGGRVWFDGLNESGWHHAVGGGLFISPMNMLVLQASYAVSDVDSTVDVRVGFFF